VPFTGLLFTSVRTPLNLTTGGTTAFAAARAACCARRDTEEQINRSQTLIHNFVRAITILLFFYDAEGGRERAYLANELIGSTGNIEKDREKTTKHVGIHAGQAGKSDG
jgi:hypothetical protein